MNVAGPLAAFLDEALAAGASLLTNEPLARHTTFRIGGPADLFATVWDAQQLIALVDLAARHDVPAFILGGGSNVLVSDRGIRGLVIANQSRRIDLSLRPDTDNREAMVVVESGVSLAGLARWTIREGWSGLEWAVTIPGTVGGAVVGNAGAFEGNIAGSLISARIKARGGTLTEISTEDLAFSYRSSRLKRAAAEGKTGAAVVSATFAVCRGDSAVMGLQAETNVSRRRASQPTQPSAGSIFRNPLGDFAGRLIESSGLKGKKSGGAMISPKHANFIVNTDGATAADVSELMRRIQGEVMRKHGIWLEPEILLVGEWAGQEPRDD